MKLFLSAALIAVSIQTNAQNPATDYKGGYNNFVSRRELARMSYAQLLNRLLSMRKVESYERAA